MRRTIALLAAAALAVATSGSASATVTPEKLIGGKLDQVSAFSNGAYITWASTTKTPPDYYLDVFNGWYPNAFARALDGTETIQLNREGTWAAPGGFDPGTNTVLFQQIGRDSNLYFYDLDTDTRSLVPGVNGRSDNGHTWEWTPRISASYILFFRPGMRIDGVMRTTAVLYDRASQEREVIADAAKAKTFWTTSVGESYAAWALCRDRQCSAFVYDIASGTTTRIPTVSGRSQFSPVLDEANGRVYFVRSGDRCGANVQILRVPIDDLSATPTEIVDFDADVDLTMSLAPNAAGDGLDLLFERLDCETHHDDLYVARDVTSVPDA